jgi:heptosyltransferase-2
MNILLVQTAFLGDVISITPLIRTAKKLFPQSKIDVLVIPQMSDIFLHNPHIDEILIFDKRKNKILNFVKTLSLLRKKYYNIALLPLSLMITSFLIFFYHIKTRIGFRRWLSSLLLTHRVPFRQGIYRIEKNLDLLTPFLTEAFDIRTIS